MEYAQPMDILQAPQRHHHPALHISLLKDQRLVLDNRLEIRVEVFKHQVDVLFD